MKKISELNIEDLIKAVFPFSKDLQIVESIYIEKGLAEWPTWFVVLYRGSLLDDYLLLSICEHADYTRTRFLKEDKVEGFKKALNVAIEKNEVFHFYWFDQSIGDENFMNLNEMSRLYSYLKIRHIELFEPTN